jgi:hypothetical protein
MEKGKVKVNKRRNFNEGIYPIEELKPSPLSPVVKKRSSIFNLNNRKYA